MQELTGTMRNYAWGSYHLLSDFLGFPSPSELPEAELWFGANPLGSSFIGHKPLTAIISEDVPGQLGIRNTRLPFLVKLLAAGEPLSIQVHPTKKQAERGFAQENAREIPLTSPSRNYKDNNHKPELLIAISPFQALAGFRPLQKTAVLFSSFSGPELDRYKMMINNEKESESLTKILTSWISLAELKRKVLIDELLMSISHYKSLHGTKTWISEVGEIVTMLHNKYPYDIGILAALLLNFVRLEPGEAIYLGAGQMHSYLSGLGLEVQANSDNVLRGGLTKKHVDVQELLKILSFSTLDDPKIRANPDGFYPVPIEEFNVQLACDCKKTLPSGKPYIVLCTKGSVSADNSRILNQGGAGWVAASDADTKLVINGNAFICS